MSFILYSVASKLKQLLFVLDSKLNLDHITKSRIQCSVFDHGYESITCNCCHVLRFENKQGKKENNIVDAK